MPRSASAAVGSAPERTGGHAAGVGGSRRMRVATKIYERVASAGESGSSDLSNVQVTCTEVQSFR